MASQYDDYCRPIVSKWAELIREAEKAKKPFQDVADQLMSFFAAKHGFIWEQEFRTKYLNLTNVNELPRHRLSFNKAFEFVALFGPLLYWDNPQRVVKPRKMLEITPEAFGITPPMLQAWQQYQQAMQQYQQAMAQWQQAAMSGAPPNQPVPPGYGAPPQAGQQWPAQPGQVPGGPAPGQPPATAPGQPQPPQAPPQPPPPPQIDPQLMQTMQIWEWSQQTQQQRAVADNIRSQLLQGWLNYIPTETPYGGLARHSRRAIVEALVKGRGVLWTGPRQFPGSDKVIISSEYDTVDNFLIDPDATSLADAQWIAQRVETSVGQAEEEFGWARGSLEGKGAAEMSVKKAKPIANNASTSGENRKDRVGRTTEMLTYYKIWSRCGVGTRLVGQHVDPDMKANLERVTGQFVFLCIAPNVNCPLNLPADKLETMTDEEVSQALSWPFDCWRDDRWPVAVLDFYEHPNRAWPIAPLAPALGELIFLQVVMSHLADRIVKSSRDFIAVLQSAGEDIELQIKEGGDLTVLKLTEVHNDIGKVVQFLQQPNVRQDYWAIVDRVNQLFERRTGLTELMAGQTTTQSRSAADANIKGNQINVRPEDMQRRVEEWQTEVARLEKIATRKFIEPEDVQFLFGPVGAYLWQQYITTQDPELVVRETDCTIEAGSVRKPNKERDVQNVNSMMQFMAPLLNQIYMQMGNPQPMQWLVKKAADVYDWETMGLQFPTPQPPQPDPMQQQMAQLDLQGKQMELQGKQMDMQRALVQGQADQQVMMTKAQTDVQTGAAKSQLDQQRFQLEIAKMQLEYQIKMQELEAKQLQAQADIQQSIVDSQDGRGKAEAEAQSAQVKLAGQAAQIEMAQRKAERELQLQEAKAQQELRLQELKNEQEMTQRAQSAEQRQREQLQRDPIAALFGQAG